MNNRKQTPGREYGKIKSSLILGYAVTAKKIDEHGKPTNNTFSTFIPVEVSQIKIDQKLPTNQIKKLKNEHVQNAIDEAYGKAVTVQNSQKFPCVIIIKRKETDIAFKRN